MNDVTDTQIANLRAAAHAAGDTRTVAACDGCHRDPTSAGAVRSVCRRLGLVYRRHVLFGPGPARSGWWREPFGPAARVYYYYGARGYQACRTWCGEQIAFFERVAAHEDAARR